MTTIDNTTAAAVASSGNVRLELKGAKSGTIEVPLGTKLKDAIKKLNEDITPELLTLREGDTARPVSLDRVLNADLVVTVTLKSSGS